MIQKVKISELSVNPKNPRTISEPNFKKLIASIKKNPNFFEVLPIAYTIEGGNKIVFSGNQRLRALLELGWDDVFAVDVSHWSKSSLRDYVVVANTHYGENDLDLLSSEYSVEELTDYGVELPAYLTSDYDKESKEEELEDNYKEQYGVIVECQNQLEQQKVFEKITELGFKAKVVCV